MKYEIREMDGIGMLVKKESAWKVLGENIAFVILLVTFAAFMLYIAYPALN